MTCIGKLVSFLVNRDSEVFTEYPDILFTLITKFLYIDNNGLTHNGIKCSTIM